MGLHRDGARWNLDPDLVEQRRSVISWFDSLPCAVIDVQTFSRVFWECHSADIFQANCNSRPLVTQFIAFIDY